MKLPLKNRSDKRNPSLEEHPVPKRRRPKRSKRPAAPRKKREFHFSFLSKISPRLALLILFAVIVVSAGIFILVSTLMEKEKEEAPEYDPQSDFYSEGNKEYEFDIPDVSSGYSYYKFDSSTLVEYTGDVDILSFNQIVAYTSRAFDGDENAKEIDSRSLTAKEFWDVLEALYEKGYIILSPNDIVEETVAFDGSTQIKVKSLLLPKNRIPIVLIFQDLDYSPDSGYADGLIINKNGDIWSQSTDENGNDVLSPELDVITLLDKFVSYHPDFSFNGAKGCIAITGQDGVLGFNTQSSNKDEENRQYEIAYAKAVVSRLKNTGWSFACHTYSHIDIAGSEYTTVVSDITKWVNEVGPIVGSTKVFVYPESDTREAVLPVKEGDTYNYLLDLGFEIFAASGNASALENLGSGSAVLCTYMIFDGYALRYSRDQLLDIVDVASIYDSTVRTNYGTGYTVSTPDTGSVSVDSGADTTQGSDPDTDSTEDGGGPAE